MIERDPMSSLLPLPPRSNEGGTTDTSDTKTDGKNLDAK
jgi:hypothetical protein